MDKTMNFIDKFLYKLIIGLFILLGLVLLDRFTIFDLDIVKNKMSEHYNSLKTIQVLNGKLNLINLGSEEEVSVTTEYLNVEYLDENIMRIKVDELTGVKNHIAGVVVKVIKEDLYTISILGIDDKLYVYSNLESFDYHIYSYLKTDEIIGRALEYYDLEISS